MSCKSLFNVLSGLLIISLLFIFTPIETFSSTYMSKHNSPRPIIEILRLKVPKADRDIWLEAEKATWEPWLAKQNGFIERKLFWDKDNEEAMLMIKWASRKQWKNIPETEVNQIQESFEKLAREISGKKSGNPFPLVFEGELLPQ